MVSRPKPAPVPSLPGPADYTRLIPPLGKDRPAFTIASRHVVRPDDIPAPGEYDVPETWRSSVAFTIAGRHPVRMRGGGGI